MAESDAKQQHETVQDQGSTLKYLEFVLVAAVHAIMLFSSIYDFAKENSGPLKPGVQTVEGTVKTVIGPVYEKFHDIPFELLKFADRKVEGFVKEVDRHVPVLVKEASSHAYTAAHKAPELARCLTSEVQRVGVVDTAKMLYARYEPVAEGYAVLAWRSLNGLPLFPEVAHIVVPTAAYWSEKYNKGVKSMAERGYGVAACMPLVPTERIAKVFGENGEEVSSSSSSSKPKPHYVMQSEEGIISTDL